ncbi:hypothetical protein QJS66_11420 [Kocuria rhizophila]|nr:hypothetical protein QJS66_11420 [Kocuria rhizophila]
MFAPEEIAELAARPTSGRGVRGRAVRRQGAMLEGAAPRSRTPSAWPQIMIRTGPGAFPRCGGGDRRAARGAWRGAELERRAHRTTRLAMAVACATAP